MKTNKKQVQLYQVTNKVNNLSDFINGVLNKTLNMFSYEGLPETLPRFIIEKFLQLNGYCVVFKYGGQLYATTGGLNGQEKSPYNLPTRVNVNVPALGISQNLEIGKNCVLIKNDDLMTGLLPTLRKHGTLIVENEITMLLNSYNDRIGTLISGGSDQTINSANQYLNNIVDGNLVTVAESSFLNDLSVHNAQTGAKITFDDLTTYQQFLVSDLYNELGINTNNNMKKERLITSEIDNNDQQTFPLVDAMFQNRLEGFTMVNKLFNGNIEVDYNSAWKDKAEDRNTPDEQEKFFNGNSAAPTEPETENAVAEKQEPKEEPKEEQKPTNKVDEPTKEPKEEKEEKEEKAPKEEKEEKEPKEEKEEK